MADIQNSPTNFVLRSSQPGDLGLITLRHGILYDQEYGWDARFESLVARICADYIDNFDASSDRLWIAESATKKEFLGCIMLVRNRTLPNTAKLRLLLVEPSARGLGLGGRLIQETLGFARQAAYDRVELWTQSSLLSARRLYQKAGFELIRQEPYENFGVKLITEFWELPLRNS